jgi:hypothetical protein
VSTTRLGEVTAPSGDLLLMDGGYLGLWSGDRDPESVRGPDIPASTDFEIVGADAEAAARSFGRQPGRTIYDIPHHAAAEFTAMFDAHCREHGLRAELRPFDAQVPHRDRARRAKNGYFLVSGVPVVCVGGLPTDRPLPVTATPVDEDGYEWREIRVEIADAPVAGTRRIGDIGVDWARFAIGDADALNAWIHEDPIDGRADVVFWGRDADEVAERVGAPRLSDEHGWVDLPVEEALTHARELDALRNSPDGPRFAFDFRPHSHHWQVMAGVRAADHEAATIEIGGATVLFAMTSVGDGFFPVDLDVDADGAPVAIRITVSGDD